MATMKNGTSTRGGVRSTMSPPFSGKGVSGGQGVGGGTYGQNKAPFDKPHSVGNGGIPVKMFDGMPEKKATTANASSAPLKRPGPTQAVGTRRFKK